MILLNNLKKEKRALVKRPFCFLQKKLFFENFLTAED